jgi:Ni/Fe-hydrogenase subunit HybB-like protein
MNSTLTNKTRILKDTLWFFVFFGLIAAIFRIWFGLGATTNLTDAVPWGLWKVFNMIAGVALSTCGFTLGFLVYVLKIEKFKPLLKPAILIAFLGYGSSCFALLFDIGLSYLKYSGALSSILPSHL